VSACRLDPAPAAPKVERATSTRLQPGNRERLDADSVIDMQKTDNLKVTQTSRTYWVVQGADGQLSGGVTRKAAEAERELVNRLRSRTAQMRSFAPRRARAGERPAR
jgi:hypothetical protein